MALLERNAVTRAFGTLGRQCSSIHVRAHMPPGTFTGRSQNCAVADRSLYQDSRAGMGLGCHIRADEGSDGVVTARQEQHGRQWTTRSVACISFRRSKRAREAEFGSSLPANAAHVSPVWTQVGRVGDSAMVIIAPPVKGHITQVVTIATAHSEAGQGHPLIGCGISQLGAEIW